MNELKTCINYIILICEKCSLNKTFKTFLPILLIFTSLFFAFPSYDLINKGEFNSNWDAILLQTSNPFSVYDYNPFSHEANLTYRLTPVIIGHLLGFTEVTDYLLLQLVFLVFLFVLITKIFFNIFGSCSRSLIFSSSVAFIFVGNVLCSDYRGFFDVLAFVLMLIPIYSNQPLIVFFSSFLAYFTDERALIASPLIYIIYIIKSDIHISKRIGLKNFFTFSSNMLALLVSWICYFVCRWLLGFFLNFETNSEGMIKYLINYASGHINVAPFAIWTGLEGFWIIVLLSSFILIYKKEWTLLLFYCITKFSIIFIALWTFDITRSMAYLMPSIFLSVLVLKKMVSTKHINYLAFFTFLLCFFPTYYSGGPSQIQWLYPLPIQLLRFFILNIDFHGN